jgi:predicted GIY-YIG superfamily endonuclease
MNCLRPLGRLVWCEHYEDISAAIQQESNMKHWPRLKKFADPRREPGMA